MTQAGYFVAAYSIAGEFPGAQVWVSYDGGYTYSFAQYIDEAATVGRVLTDLSRTALSDQSSLGAIVDKSVEPEVEVLTYGRSLEGVSEANLFAGSNHMAVKVSEAWYLDHARWEIIGFQEAEEQVDGNFILKNLLRGRSGTNFSTWNRTTGNPQLVFNGHAANDQFVLLEEGRIFFVPIPEAYWEWGVLRFKFVPPGSSLQNCSAYSANLPGFNIRPYSPVHIKAVRSYNEDITFSWTRRSRSRLGWGYSDTPLYEASEKYEILITDGATSWRTIEVEDATEVVYTALQQETDWGAYYYTKDEMTIQIHQLGDTIGAGFPETITVPIISERCYNERPSITSPSNNATDVSQPITVTSDMLSLHCFRPIVSEVHESSSWQVATDVNFRHIVWESLEDTVNKTSVSLSGLSELTEHWVRVRYHGDHYGDSSWSSPIKFTTADVYAQTPSITSPSNGASGISPALTITASSFTMSGGADTHASTDWQIAEDSGFSIIAYESLSDTTNLESISVPSGELSRNTQYFVRVKYNTANYGSSNWSPTVSFTTTSVQQPTITSAYTTSSYVAIPFNVAANAFSSLNGSDVHDATDWEIAAAGSLEYGTYQYFTSYNDTLNLTSVTVSSVDWHYNPPQEAPMFNLEVRVRYHGSETGWSEWSEPLNFTIGFIHQPEIYSPSDGSSSATWTINLSSDPLSIAGSGTATHEKTDWYVSAVALDVDENIIAEEELSSYCSYDDETNLDSYTINLSSSDPWADDFSVIHVACRYYASPYGHSQWSDGTYIIKMPNN
jgi:hypothetical protein